MGTDLGKKFVLVLKPDHSIDYRLVELGPEIDGLRVVQQGLQPDGDVIVVNGLQHVHPGQDGGADPRRHERGQRRSAPGGGRGRPQPVPLNVAHAVRVASTRVSCSQP